jgi:hypothetical protein
MLLGSPTVARRAPRSATLANLSSLFVGLLPELLHNARYWSAHCDAAAIRLLPVLSCLSCRPDAPFAELVSVKGRFSRASGINPGDLQSPLWVAAEPSLRHRKEARPT